MAENQEEEPSCAVCMETAGLKSHQCAVCKPDAWAICSSCEGKLLSRECPMCRGPYAPRLFHPWPFKLDFSSREALRVLPSFSLFSLFSISLYLSLSLSISLYLSLSLFLLFFWFLLFLL